MTVEAFNIKYEQRTKVWEISGFAGIESLLNYQRQKEQTGDVDDALLSLDICPSTLRVTIPDCDFMDIEKIYEYTKSAIELKTKQKVLDFNVRY